VRVERRPVRLQPLGRQLRGPRVQRLERPHERVGDEVVPHLLLVGGHHVPRRVLGARAREHVAVGGRVRVPAQPVVEVGRVELPVLRRLVQPRPQPLRLLGARDVEEELHHGRPFVGEHALEVGDVREPPPPHGLGREPAHAHGEHVLVVRAVEHADGPARRAERVDAPQVVVRALGRRRRRERGDAEPERAAPGEHAAHGAVLPRRVAPLEHHEHGPLGLRGQQRLERAEALDEGGRGLGQGVALRNPRGRGGVAVGEGGKLTEVDGVEAHEWGRCSRWAVDGGTVDGTTVDGTTVDDPTVPALTVPGRSVPRSTDRGRMVTSRTPTAASRS
jgi:hypothetical protein